MAQSLPRGAMIMFEDLTADEKQKLQRISVLILRRLRYSALWFILSMGGAVITAWPLLELFPNLAPGLIGGMAAVLGSAVFWGLVGHLVYMLQRRRIQAEFRILKADSAANLGIGKLRSLQSVMPAVRDCCDLARVVLHSKEIDKFFPRPQPRPQRR